METSQIKNSRMRQMRNPNFGAGFHIVQSSISISSQLRKTTSDHQALLAMSERRSITMRHARERNRNDRVTFHLLKSDPEPFQDVWIGDKLCELRTNDREFAKGDWLQMFETTQDRQVFTGRSITALVSHVQRGYGLQLDSVALSMQRISRYKSKLKRTYYLTFDQVNQDSVFVSKNTAQRDPEPEP